MDHKTNDMTFPVLSQQEKVIIDQKLNGNKDHDNLWSVFSKMKADRVNDMNDLNVDTNVVSFFVTWIP